MNIEHTADVSVNAIGKHRVRKKRTHLEGRFCFHILKNMAQNIKVILIARRFWRYFSKIFIQIAAAYIMFNLVHLILVSPTSPGNDYWNYIQNMQPHHTCHSVFLQSPYHLCLLLKTDYHSLHGFLKMFQKKLLKFQHNTDKFVYFCFKKLSDRSFKQQKKTQSFHRVSHIFDTQFPNQRLIFTLSQNYEQTCSLEVQNLTNKFEPLLKSLRGYNENPPISGSVCKIPSALR